MSVPGIGRRWSLGLLREAVSGRPLSRHPATLITLLAAIALGVAMVVAVHLVNRSALEGFSAGVRTLAGKSDLTLTASHGHLPELWLQRLRAMPEVRAAWPALELKLLLGVGDDARAVTLLGLDLLNDVGLRDVYRPAKPTQAQTGSPMRLFERGAVVLGAGLARALGVASGDSLNLPWGNRELPLRVVAELQPGSAWDRGAIMDIAVAQWTFGRVGELDRIDARLRDGIDTTRFANRLQALFGERLLVSDSNSSRHQLEGMTRAYRVNLNVLSGVGLLTAGFMAWSLTGLSLRRRRAGFALLRTLGMSRALLAALLVVEAVGLGLLGSVIGLAAGVALAWAGVALLGGDLGAGYFQQTTLALWWNTPMLLFYLLLGTVVALAATLAPLRDNLRDLGGAGMQRGAAERGRMMPVARRLSLVLLSLTAAAVASQLPPWQGLPLAGYGALMLVLLASVLAMPLLVGLLARRLRPPARHWLVAMALAELRGASARAVSGASAIMVSFALVVAMATLVFSFRGTLLGWLDRVLVADVYIAAGRGSQSALDDQRIAAVAAWPELGQLGRARQMQIVYGDDPAAAPVHLQARDLRQRALRPDWPLLAGEWVSADGFDGVVYVSEVFASRFGVEPGDRITLRFAPRQPLTVAGIFRDYAFQWGQVLVDLQTYQRISGDRRIDDLALSAVAGNSSSALEQHAIREFGSQQGVAVRMASALRRVSLAVFDRSFALTYALVFVALAVGLFGIVNAQAVQGPERRQQLATLGLLGLSAGTGARLLAIEGGLIGLAGALQGLISGLLMALVLIYVVNRQSFGWGIDSRFPWLAIAAVMAVVVLLSYALSWLQGRRLSADNPVTALREE